MSKGRVTAGFSPEIQALRGLAVASVVVFHFWPNLLPGGYVGVDVFFVISGYLITAHLLREVERTGTVDLRSFWARRIRRLFPAALLVLGATLLAAVILLPIQRWQQIVTQFWSCLALVQNWVLGYSATNYFNADTDVSPLQHYWSLSVEEQFYLVWPLLMLVAALVARRFAAGRVRRIIAVVGIVLGVASFAWSIYDTNAEQTFAYFSTLTHVWEFVAGGVLAMLAGRIASLARNHPAVGHPVSLGAVLVIGLLLIVVSDFTFSGATLFPGWIAIIPVVGAVLIMAVSVVGAPGPLRSIVAFRPVTFVGDISYSLYLWHWPIIVFAPVVLGSALLWQAKLALLALSVLLAWLTKLAVEDPVRRGVLSRTGPNWSYAAGATAIVIAVAVSLVPYSNFQQQLNAATASEVSLLTEAHSSSTDCFAARAVLPGAPDSCPESHVLDPRQAQVAPWLPYIASSVKSRYWSVDWTSCPSATGSTLLPCTFGPRNADLSIAVVGDSHGFQWANAILPVAQQRHWSVEVNWEAGCGFLQPGPDLGDTNDTESSPSCVNWEKSAIKHLITEKSIDVVVVSSFTQKFAHGGSPNLAAIQRGYSNSFKALLKAGKKVVVVADTALPKTNVPNCLASTKVIVDPCTTSTKYAIHDDPMEDAATALSNPNIQVVDVNSLICDTVCHSVVGGVPVYQDAHHLSTLFLQSLAPVFDKRLTAIAK